MWRDISTVYLFQWVCKIKKSYLSCSSCGIRTQIYPCEGTCLPCTCFSELAWNKYTVDMSLHTDRFVFCFHKMNRISKICYCARSLKQVHGRHVPSHEQICFLIPQDEQGTIANPTYRVHLVETENKSVHVKGHFYRVLVSVSLQNKKILLIVFILWNDK
jgi:hypothetical protein